MIIKNLFEKPKDLRKFAEAEDDIDIEIFNKDLFINNMKEKGYEEKFKDVLVKDIELEEADEIDIILSVSDTFRVSNIILYKNNENVDLGENLLNEIVSDINDANQQ